MSSFFFLASLLLCLWDHDTTGPKCDFTYRIGSTTILSSFYPKNKYKVVLILDWKKLSPL